MNIDSVKPTTSRPSTGWRTLWLLIALAVFGAAMLLVGKSHGARIFATVAAIYGDVFGTPTDEKPTAGEHRFYSCGMHPWVILPKEGLCPICQMDLTPLDPKKFSAEIAIDPVLAQNIGVRTTLVEKGAVVGNVRTVGKIEYDETSLHDVNLRVAGWIEDLHVDQLGARVLENQPLFSLFAPELVSAQQEYLLAIKQRDLPAVSFLPRMTDDLASGIAAARARIASFGIDDAQITELEKSGVARKSMTIVSPCNGTVIQKMAVAGMRVEPGMKLYRIANLDRVWVIAAIYESQLPFVELGQPAVVSLSYVPGTRFEGHVGYVYPWTDEKTRQINVRLEFDNPDGLLKPGMFAKVELRRTVLEARTLVDRSAVIDTGERRVAIASLGNGRFEARSLTLGIDTGDGRVEVLSGLSAGERVVSSAQFLLDSESKLKEGLLRMVRDDLVVKELVDSPAPALVSLPAALRDSLRALITAYIEIGDRLANDSLDGIDLAAHRISDAAKTASGVAIPGDEQFWHQHGELARIGELAAEMTAERDLAASRLSYAELSTTLSRLLRLTGVPGTYEREVVELHCPMFLEAQGGAHWIQHLGSARNPYFGHEMLTCFDTRAPLPAAVGEPDAEPAAIDALVAAYLSASAALAADRVDGVSASFLAIREQGTRLANARAPLGDLALRVVRAVPDGKGDLVTLRNAFGPLSTALIELVRVAPPAGPLWRAYCPMAKASWLQADQTLRNPYMGTEMLECGSVDEALPARSAGERGR